METFYKGKKVLITGHTGFKGSWLARILVNFGAEVVGISLKPQTEPNLFDVLGLGEEAQDGGVKSYFEDIREYDAMRDIFKKEQPEIVFHMAAEAIVRRSYDDPLGTFSTNVMGTTNILQAITETPSVKSAVIITTDKVYYNREWDVPYKEEDKLGGHDPYSASKAAADIITQSYIKSFFNPDQYGKKHSTGIAIARAGNVIGGGDWAPYRLVPDIIRSIYEKGENIIIRSPDSVRPWEHVLEPLSGYLLLAKGLYEGNIHLSGAWNFGPEDESFVPVKKLVEDAIRVLGKGTLEIQPDASKHEAKLLMLDINKAKSELGWKPKFNFDQNLETTFAWYKHYYSDQDDNKNGQRDIRKLTDEQIKLFFSDN